MAKKINWFMLFSIVKIKEALYHERICDIDSNGLQYLIWY